MSKKQQHVAYARNPIYIFYALGGLVLFLLCALAASRLRIGALEQAIFNLFYNLPGLLKPVFKFITLFGTIGVAVGVSVVFLLFRRRDIAIRVFVASTLAYYAASFLKGWVVRARPQYLLNYVVPRDHAAGSGFPSGHSAVATAMGLTLALYAPPKLRKWIIFGIFLICISRIYLGVHLPVDVIGGYAIGLFFYSLTSLLFGTIHKPVSLSKLVQSLSAGGMKGLKLEPAKVDARGSVPFFGEYEGGPVFVKVFNQENNAADWLFKIARRIKFKRLEDETPSLTPKRAVEHEAYITMLAKYYAGVRSTEIVGVYKVSPSQYAIAMKRLGATGLDKVKAAELNDELLQNAWDQINKLHASLIIHKDLRAANIMVDAKTGQAWIIDFGFSESAVDATSFYRDNVEFIASTSVLVGAKRAVAAARRALGKQAIKEAIPYMQYAALSGATTTALKHAGTLLKEIRSAMYAAAGVNPKEVKNTKMTRISKSKLFQIGVIVVLLAILIPQIDTLKEGLGLLKTANLAIFAGALVLSVLTYAWAALSYKTLSDIPLPLRRLFVVQWAGSFANRLLPAGIGGLSFNTMFMHKSGHNEGKSGTIAGVNNLLGVVSSVILITIALLIWSTSYNLSQNINVSVKTILIILLILAGIITILVIIYKRSKGLQAKVKQWATQSKVALKNYAGKPMVLLSALGAQLLITLTYTGVMVVSALALGTHLDYTQALFAISMGTLIGSITPTPGGIGGAEAGIVMALTIVGLSADLAFAIAMLYRLATFWLTIPPGYIAYRYSFAKGYYN